MQKVRMSLDSGTHPSTGRAGQSTDKCCEAGASEHAPSDATVESVVGCSASQVAEMQDSVRSALEGDTGAISAARVLHLYLERLSIDFQACPSSYFVLMPSQQTQLGKPRSQRNLMPAAAVCLLQRGRFDVFLEGMCNGPCPSCTSQS